MLPHGHTRQHHGEEWNGPAWGRRTYGGGRGAGGCFGGKIRVGEETGKEFDRGNRGLGIDAPQNRRRAFDSEPRLRNVQSP